MKLLIMCEGPNEKEIIDILLEHGKLIFTADDLLGLVPYHARQIKNSGQVKAALNIYPEEVKVLRVGDTQSQKHTIPAEYIHNIVGEEKYCTKPELELLLIISEGLYDQYEKVKSKMKPKDFAKQNIKLGKKRYNNSTQFYRDYYGNNVDSLVSAIIVYRRKKGTHKKDELYLADLLVEK